MRSWSSYRPSRRDSRFAGRNLRVETLETRDVFAAGDLDTSFGTSGVARVDNDPAFVETVRVGGQLYVSNGTAFVAKLNSQGGIDSSFGNAGQGTIGHEFLAVQSGGAVVTGFTEFGSASLDAVLRRLTPGGAVDATFGAGGSVTIDFLPRMTGVGSDPNVADYIADVDVDGSDRIWMLVHGDLAYDQSVFLPEHFAGVARLNSQGVLDATFGIDGLMAVEAAITDSFQASDMILTSDGGAMIAGVYRTNGVSNAALYKINASGAVVTSFGVNGRVLLTQFGETARFAKVQIAADSGGGFYVGAYNDPDDGTYNLKLAKITATGAAATFGTGGVVDVGNSETNFTLGGDGFALSVQNDGKPLVAYGGPNWNLARFTAAGAVDATFGVNGVVQTSLGAGAGAYAVPQSILPQSDGTILVSGSYAPGGTAVKQSVVARYFAFDSNGAAASSVAPLAATVYQNNLTVSWSGIPAPGSTITGYDVYYQLPGENPVLWQSNTTATSAVFNVTAARGKTVGFYSVARDDQSRIEPAPGAPDASTSYIGAPWQNPVDRFDVNIGGTDTGSIDPTDILFVIDEFNSHEISSASGEVILPPTKTYAKGRFVDVDGDNLISPSDILFVIVRYGEVIGGGEGESTAAAALAATAPPTTAAPTTPAPSASPSTSTSQDDLLEQLAWAWLADDDDDE